MENCEEQDEPSLLTRRARMGRQIYVHDVENKPHDVRANKREWHFYAWHRIEAIVSNFETTFVLNALCFFFYIGAVEHKRFSFVLFLCRELFRVSAPSYQLFLVPSTTAGTLKDGLFSQSPRDFAELIVSFGQAQYCNATIVFNPKRFVPILKFND